jgi:polyhydroxyalkanoate synthesis regulator phasin
MSLETDLNSLKNRVKNLEEAVSKLVTLYSNFASNKEVQELIAVISDSLKENKESIQSLESRIDILEDIPDIDF